jgi:hypothetical protein
MKEILGYSFKIWYELGDSQIQADDIVFIDPNGGPPAPWDSGL